MEIRRTIALETLAEVETADDAQGERGEGKDHRRGGHQAEEQPGGVRPTERRSEEHSCPAANHVQGNAQEDEHALPEFVADRNPALLRCTGQINQILIAT